MFEVIRDSLLIECSTKSHSVVCIYILVTESTGNRDSNEVGRWASTMSKDGCDDGWHQH